MTFNPTIIVSEYRVQSSPLADLIKLTGSPVPEISDAIRQASAVGRSPILEVDLGDGHQWWHTRLYLLAALAEDYTKIAAIAFHADRPGRTHSYVGMAGPGATRLALAAVTPQLQTAYAGAQVAQAQPVHSVDAVLPLATNFPFFVNQAAGMPETAVKIDVNEPLLVAWLGPALQIENIPWTAAPEVPLPAAQLRPILEQGGQYVALTSNDRLLQMVDRQELVDRLAVDALFQST